MVAIKDFEIPSSCSDCTLCKIQRGYDCCCITNEQMDWNYMDEYRSDNCPLVEIEEQTDAKEKLE